MTGEPTARSASDCLYRMGVESQNGEPFIHCGYVELKIGRLSGISSDVHESVCDHCCRFPPPNGDNMNYAVAASINKRLRILIETGGAPQCSVEQARSIKASIQPYLHRPNIPKSHHLKGYRPHAKDTFSQPIPSPKLRSASGQLPITANMATMPSRQSRLPFAIRSLLPQVDLVRVYLNGYQEIPHWLKLQSNVEVIVGSDLGAAGKFFWANRRKASPEVYFVVDDDFIYPPSFVHDHLLALDHYQGNAAITLHGACTSLPIQDYVTDRRIIPCMKELSQDCHVTLGGTGVMCFRTDTLPIRLSDFRWGCATDIEFSAFCHRRNFPIVCRSHPAGVKADSRHEGYLRYMRPDDQNIYGDLTRPHSKLIAQIVNALFLGSPLPEECKQLTSLKHLLHVPDRDESSSHDVESEVSLT